MRLWRKKAHRLSGAKCANLRAGHGVASVGVSRRSARRVIDKRKRECPARDSTQRPQKDGHSSRLALLSSCFRGEATTRTIARDRSLVSIIASLQTHFAPGVRAKDGDARFVHKAFLILIGLAK